MESKKVNSEIEGRWGDGGRSGVDAFQSADLPSLRFRQTLTLDPKDRSVWPRDGRLVDSPLLYISDLILK